MTIHEREADNILQTYKRFPIEIDHGEGMYLVDVDGNRYLDFLGGVAVNALGYGNRSVLDAIQRQAEKYIHVSNYFVQEAQVELAEKLTCITGYSKVFFCNSGTEANEGALKIARKWGNKRGKTNVVSMENSFHGRTFGALSLMSNADYREGFGAFLDGCIQIPFNDSEQLLNSVNEKTEAVFLECIQGEGGVVEITDSFAEQLHELKEKFGFLLMLDEVQSGVGRTGKFFGYEHYGLQPDIVTLAKPLGGGIPLGAILVRKEFENVLQPGNHGTTFGGNPVACAAGIAVLHEIVDGRLLHNAEAVGSYFLHQLKSIQRKNPALIKDVRGKGLMIGIELSMEGKPIVDALLERKILINCTHKTVLRFLPPLITTNEHVDEVCSALIDVMRL